MVVSQKKALLIGGSDTDYHRFGEYRDKLLHLCNKYVSETVITEDCDAFLTSNIKDFSLILCCMSQRHLTDLQEEGLLSAIAGLNPNITGSPKTFIGMHAASTSSSPSMGYERMLGARFLSHPLLGKPFTVLFSAEYNGFKSPLGWVKQYGMGRVLYSAPGHGAEQLNNSNLLGILTNALHWAAG